MTAAANSRERVAVAAALFLTVVVGLWLTYALIGQVMMDDSMDMQMTVLPRTLLLFLMWWSMMMAMMLPSAAPAILTYGAIARKMPPARPMVFSLGYALVWTVFAALATLLQVWAARVVQLSGMMAIASQALGGTLLILAGLYQLTTLKRACLAKCQTPLFYLAHHWRNGAAGALRMGLSHGIYCLGCCWLLMLLLFYGGVMDFRWIVGLALYVAAEKLVPQRFKIDRLAATVLVVWGIAAMLYAWSR
jgi:predicted metal-binding membrane protein